MESVNDRLRRLMETERRFVSVEAGWQRFLHYLHARHGADIDGVHRAELLSLVVLIDDVLEEPDIRPDQRKFSSLEAFGRYDDVIAAFRKFCLDQNLHTS
jgi:hypothetical protein